MKNKNIHLIMPFSRHHLKNVLLAKYRNMGVVLHPITFQDERPFVSDEQWIRPFVVPKNKSGLMPANILCNEFIKTCEIFDDDFYCTVPDDDMYEDDVFDAIRKMDDDVVVISMKRGDSLPLGLPEEKQYSTNTLYASSENMRIGKVGGEQIFVKGKIFKECLFEETNLTPDGIMAEFLKEHFKIRYEPNLYALFNYYEPGRWDKGKSDIAFGCMVNDMKRLDLILRNSSIGNVPCFTIFDPESAAKGLNILLDTIEKSGAEVGILTHQDVFYREHWLPTVKKQLMLLPGDWVIAGIVGKDEKGILCGRFHDMSSPLWIVSGHDFPVQCSCIDECTIIVNMKTGFRFDEELEGFDLYGTYACLRANEMGSAWIIDAWAEHYCTRFHSEWEPGQVFMDMWRFLYERFPGKYLDSTVLVGNQQEEENRKKSEKKIKVTRAQFEKMQVTENNVL